MTEKPAITGWKGQDVKNGLKQKVSGFFTVNPPPPPPWYVQALELYVWYGFCSPYTLGLYAIIILFTYFQQHVTEQGSIRKFSGSWFYLGFLCFFIFISLHLSSRVWNQENPSDLFLDRACVLLFPNAVMLLFCYFRVSKVLASNYVKGKDGFFRFLQDEILNRDTPAGLSEMDGGSTGSGDMSAGTSSDLLALVFSLLYKILLLIIALLFAPVLICLNLFFNYVLVRVRPPATNQPTN